ncbi:hypothetical protein OAJ39_01560 [Alphaproteobacteria bacterium]|nr:hypothetical protein [Alphaproteobacteria bacterium]
MKKVLELSFFYAVAMSFSVGATVYISNTVTPDIYAILGIFNWVLGLSSALCLLSLPAIIRVYFTSQKYTSVVKTTLFYSIFILAFLAILVSVLPEYFSRVTKLDSKWLWVLIVGNICTILMSYCQTVFQCKSRFISFGFMMIIQPVLLLLFAVLLLSKGASSGNLLETVSYAQVSLLIILIVIFVKMAGLRNPFSVSETREVLNFTGPLIPHTILGYLSLGIDRYLVSLFLTGEEIGVYFLIFTYCSVLSVIGDLGTKLYQNWLYPALSNKSVSRSEIDRNVRWLLLLVLAFLPASYYSLGFAFALLLPEDYLSGITLYPIFILGIALSFVYLIYIQFVVFFKKTFILPIITGLSLLASSFGGIFLYLYFDLGIYSFVIGFSFGQAVAASLAFLAARYYLGKNV